LQVGRDVVELTGGALAGGAPVDASAAFPAVRLPPSTSLAGEPATFGTGSMFAFVHVADDRDVTRAAVEVAAVRAIESSVEVGGIDVFAWDAESRTAHCRVFTSHVPAGEDPATGSAALALGAYLVSAGLLPADGESHYLVRQGAELGRPSRLECTVVAQAGTAVECRVSGAVAPVAAGEIRRPPRRR
jgi:trans-2,3-dihydro-3-hydroxyanthranilate isomerase